MLVCLRYVVLLLRKKNKQIFSASDRRTTLLEAEAHRDNGKYCRKGLKDGNM